MRHTALRAALFAAALAAVVAPSGGLLAQREGYTYLSYVGRDVSLVSPADEDSAARLNTPVLSGDVLVTGEASRAEAILADGNVVRLDGRSELRFERMNRTYESDDDRTLLALARGSAVVEVREVSTRDRALRLDTDDATVLSPARSVFRVDAGRRGTEVYVLAGKVEVNGRGGRALVRAGEYAFVSGDTEIEVEAATAPRDRFARFVEERRDRADRRDVTRYVESEYAYDSDAADFEDYGSWSYVGGEGAWGWRPNVGPDWTPYSLGTWRWTPCGLTWVSYEPWGWLPYHYGTWIFDPVLGWVWIPANLYAPAWVYWSSGPGWTGWCPVGWVGGPYYATYARSTRIGRGNERGGPWMPHLRGKVEVTQIDRRGWNFVPTSRLGTRLGAGDVTRGDRVPFPRGETIVVSSAPLRLERGASPAQSVPEAIRRSASTDGRAAASEGLTSILRRDRTLDTAGAEELRRSAPTFGRGAVARNAAPDAPRPPERREAWRESPDRAGGARAGVPLVREAPRSRADEGWRSYGSPAPGPVQRRDVDRRESAGDTGWRAPSPRVIERSADRPSVGRGDAPVRREPAPVREAPRQAPPRHESVRSAPAPVYSAPVRSAPAPVYSAPVHAAPAPPSAPAPAPDRGAGPAPRGR